MLARSGYVELVGTERRRGATTHLYRASISPEIDGVDWEALPVDVRRGLTLGLLQLTMDEARRGALAGGFDESETQVTRSPLLLDAAGVDAAGTLLRSAYAELQAIVAACAERRSHHPGALRDRHARLRVPRPPQYDGGLTAQVDPGIPD